MKKMKMFLKNGTCINLMNVFVSYSGTHKAGASVAPGKRFTYHWRVTEGPSDSDPPCISYLYYSSVDPVRDTNSGLIGPIQVCKKGVLDQSGHQVRNTHTQSYVMHPFD